MDPAPPIETPKPTKEPNYRSMPWDLISRIDVYQNANDKYSLVAYVDHQSWLWNLIQRILMTRKFHLNGHYRVSMWNHEREVWPFFVQDQYEDKNVAVLTATSIADQLEKRNSNLLQKKRVTKGIEPPVYSSKVRNQIPT